MRSFRYIILFLPFLIIACGDNHKELSQNEILRIQRITEDLIVDNLHDWEPPFREEDLLEDFSRGIAFSFTADGYHIDNFSDWQTIVYESMAYDRSLYKEYKHTLSSIRSVVLGSTAALVTVNYVWEGLSIENVHSRTPATLTAVCRLEEGAWKIMSAHVSHGEQMIVTDEVRIKAP